jgi:hypothetical protein
MKGPEPDPERVRQVEESFIPRFQHLPDEDIHVEMRKYLPGTAEILVLSRMLEERHRAAAEPEQRRFERTYEQTERHQRELKRAARIAALVSIIGALASWIGVWFQWHSRPTAAPASPPPAVASPSPTQAAPTAKAVNSNLRN